MMPSKEAQLTSAVMMYALRCLQEGDQDALRDMNFGPTEIAALRDLDMADFCQLEHVRVHCLAVELNRDVYWPMLKQMKSRRASEELQHELIRADASHDMMQTFFGMSGREYTRLRKSLLPVTTTGRPAEPTEAETNAIWKAWRAREARARDGLLPPADYLAIHRDTGVAMRAIWRQTRMGLDFAD